MIAPALALGPIVLASRSPQRRAILEQLGIEFEVRPSDYREDPVAGLAPPELAVAHAAGKAHDVAGRGGDRPVLAVDTVVALGERTFGNPRDEDEAREFLRSLSGRTHDVHSGLCLIVGGRAQQGVATTRVTMQQLSHADMDWYVARGEWRDRAGGYAIQGAGAALVVAIDGDYTNVVGLPVPVLLDAMAKAVR